MYECVRVGRRWRACSSRGATTRNTVGWCCTAPSFSWNRSVTPLDRHPRCFQRHLLSKWTAPPFYFSSVPSSFHLLVTPVSRVDAFLGVYFLHHFLFTFFLLDILFFTISLIVVIHEFVVVILFLDLFRRCSLFINFCNFTLCYNRLSANICLCCSCLSFKWFKAHVLFYV